MTATTTTRVREHYAATGLTDRIRSALSTIAPEDQTLSVAQLAPLDEFHTRGAGGRILATQELARPRTDWFTTTVAWIKPSPSRPGVGLNLGVVLGPEFQAMTANLARNIREQRLGVLSAVMLRGV